MAREPNLGTNLKDVEWKPLHEVTSIPPESQRFLTEQEAVGVLLSLDAETGARTTLLKAPPGMGTAARESHPCTQEYWIIEGDLTIGDVELGPGTYVCLPAGMTHGPTKTMNGVVLLMWTDGPISTTFYDE